MGNACSSARQNRVNTIASCGSTWVCVCSQAVPPTPTRVPATAGPVGTHSYTHGGQLSMSSRFCDLRAHAAKGTNISEHVPRRVECSPAVSSRWGTLSEHKIDRGEHSPRRAMTGRVTGAYPLPAGLGCVFYEIWVCFL